MYIQIQNKTLKKNNQFRAQTMPGALKKLKELGWKSKDCTFKQLDKALVDNKYKELDGRMNVRGKQFMQRSIR
tara:strand:+ start:499 stop:717 length:219 start_codon:yes stop_codon:yes gene_type:complete